MADQDLLHKVHDLSDLELAALICLVAQEHCIIDTDEDSIDELVQELELVCRLLYFPAYLLTRIPDRRPGLRPIPRNRRRLRTDRPPRLRASPHLHRREPHADPE